MIVCENHRLLYLAPMKTGTVSISWELLHKPPFEGSVYNRQIDRHVTHWEDRFQDWYIFITVRHPYTRFFSFWRHTCQQIMKHKATMFRDALWYAPNKHWFAGTYDYYLPDAAEFAFDELVIYHLTHWGCCDYHLQKLPRPVDKVVHTESYEQDLAEIPHFKDVKFSRLNETKPMQKPWYEYATPAIIEWIGEVWSEDFEQFGYTRDFEAVKAGHYFLGEQG